MRSCEWKISTSNPISLFICIAVDTDRESRKVHYPQLSRVSPDKRRVAFWKCATVLFASSVRCNPRWRPVLYTNDLKPVVLRGMEIRDVLRGFGVEIRYLPFSSFKAPAVTSRAWRNVYYRFEVLSDIAKHESGYSLLMDTDCVWVRSGAMVEAIALGGNPLLYDISEKSGGFAHSAPKEKMLACYRMIDPEFFSKDLRFYGGELLGARPEIMREVSNDVQWFFQRVLNCSVPSNPGLELITDFLQNDQLISNYSYNKRAYPVIDASSFMRRIWTGLNGVVTEADLNLALWHLPNEKMTGFRSLFEECIDEKSQFWSTPLDGFPACVGQYMGIPRRTIYPRKSLSEKLWTSRTAAAKAVMPLSWYNGVRQVFGHQKIDSKQ
jgi:hypothetical protein